jgi:hypothetical protein
MRQKKYELVPHLSVSFAGRTLYRIRALRNVRPGVKVGDFGGYIESELNLSHDGTSWVGGVAKVHSKGRVFEDDLVYVEADVGDSVRIFGDAEISGRTVLRGDHQICGDTRITSGIEPQCDGEAIADESEEAQPHLN